MSLCLYGINIKSRQVKSKRVYVSGWCCCFIALGTNLILYNVTRHKPYACQSLCRTSKYVLDRVRRVTSWQGTLSAQLVFWEGKPPVTGGFPSQRASYTELWCSLWCTPELRIEHTVELPVIWDAITSMWRHCNHLELIVFHCASQPFVFGFVVLFGVSRRYIVSRFIAYLISLPMAELCCVGTAFTLDNCGPFH